MHIRWSTIAGAVATLLAVAYTTRLPRIVLDDLAYLAWLVAAFAGYYVFGLLSQRELCRTRYVVARLQRQLQARTDGGFALLRTLATTTPAGDHPVILLDANLDVGSVPVGPNEEPPPRRTLREVVAAWAWRALVHLDGDADIGPPLTWMGGVTDVVRELAWQGLVTVTPVKDKERYRVDITPLGLAVTQGYVRQHEVEPKGDSSK